MKGLGLSNKDEVASFHNIEKLTKENITRILMTRPKERNNLLEFGVGLQLYLFSNFDIIKKQLKELITYQIELYETRVIINSIDLIFDKATQKITITIKYKIREKYEEPEIVLTVSVSP